jgi:hypothetical protein
VRCRTKGEGSGSVSSGVGTGAIERCDTGTGAAEAGSMRQRKGKTLIGGLSRRQRSRVRRRGEPWHKESEGRLTDGPDPKLDLFWNLILN